MQNNVTELTQRLLRALDSNYNVIDMPAVIEIVSLLEKIAITKELLETTRLGKHVNELRRKTDNDSLSKRAKELVRKWRNMILPADGNGQLKTTQRPPPPPPPDDEPRAKKRPLAVAANDGGTPPPPPQTKRPKVNGQTIELLDFSDNSNSSFKDFKPAGGASVASLPGNKNQTVILLNSDSNSSAHDPVPVKTESASKSPPPPTIVTSIEPKKRGRKKGSKNHKNLIDEAETSFSNKLAVSRGNSKVKTTQELIASLQNRTLVGGSSSSSSSVNTSPQVGGANSKSNKEDLTLRAAKLTERVSIIDQKLNTTNRFKNSQRRNRFGGPNNNLNITGDKVIESGSVINDKSLLRGHHDDEIIVVDDFADSGVKSEEDEDDQEANRQAAEPKTLSLSVEEARALLPPLDPAIFDRAESEVRCSCVLRNATDSDDCEVTNDVDGDDKCYEWTDDPECPARRHLDSKYRGEGAITVEDLHTKCLEGVNGNYGLGVALPGPVMGEDGSLYVNVVPNVMTEGFPKENFKKYSISEAALPVKGERVDEGADKEGGCDDGGGRTGDDVPSDVSIDSCAGAAERGEGEERIFREWHEVLDTPSYNGEIFKILPYVIID